MLVLMIDFYIGEKRMLFGVLIVDVLVLDDKNIINCGMKLNEVKKFKRE